MLSLALVGAALTAAVPDGSVVLMQQEEASAWPAGAWSPQGEEIVVDLHTMTPLEKSAGPRTMQWNPTTNDKQAASWTSITANVDSQRFHGIMYSKEPMSGTTMPSP